MESSQPNYRSRWIWISPMFENSLTLKLLVSASIVVGIICYCESSPFQHLYGETKPLKVAVCVMLSVGGLIITCGVFYVEKLRVLRPGQRWLIAFVVSLVLIVTSLYSFYYDKKVAEKPDILIAISNGAFVFMSLGLSKLIHVEFESGLSNYFLGCFTAQLMKINLWLIIPAAVVCYIVTFLRHHSHSEVPWVNGDIESGGQLTEEAQAQAQAQESEETYNAGASDRVENQVLTDPIAARTESIIPESIIPEPAIEEKESNTLRQRKKGTVLPPEGTRFGRLSVTPAMKMEASASSRIRRILRLDISVDTYGDFDFVRRLREPSDLRLKQLAAVTGCRVYIRGKGSMKDPDEEEKLRGRPGHEHLNEPLHILIVAHSRANIVDKKIQQACERIEEYFKTFGFYATPVMIMEAPASPSIRRILRLDVPVDTYPNSDFVKRLRGPGGKTLKEVEIITGCDLHIRGKGSIKDPDKERKLFGRPGYEHLNEPLHILIVADPLADIVDIRIQEAREIIKLFYFDPSSIWPQDFIMRQQLRELAMLNSNFGQESRAKW